MLFLVVVHVAANLVWIGSIASVGLLLARSGGANLEPAARQATVDAAAYLYRKVAVPSFGVSFLFGVAQVATHADYYLKAHWFHGKVTFGLAAIALHHVIGAKTKRSSTGSVQGGRSSAILTAALLACAFVTVLFAVFKTALIP